MASIYINWDEHKVVNAKGLEKKIDERVQDYRTQSSFEDYINEQYCASDILNMVEEDGFDETMRELQGEWETNIRDEAERDIFADWVSFDTDEDWD